jgi:hypothetical protein
MVIEAVVPEVVAAVAIPSNVYQLLCDRSTAMVVATVAAVTVEVAMAAARSAVVRARTLRAAAMTAEVLRAE